jgi:hypothetical protein
MRLWLPGCFDQSLIDSGSEWFLRKGILRLSQWNKLVATSILSRQIGMSLKWHLAKRLEFHWQYDNFILQQLLLKFLILTKLQQKMSRDSSMTIFKPGRALKKFWWSLSPYSGCLLSWKSCQEEGNSIEFLLNGIVLPGLRKEKRGTYAEKSRSTFHVIDEYHNGEKTINQLASANIAPFPHLAYSSGLTLCDYWLFDFWRCCWRRWSYYVIEETTFVSRDVTLETFQSVLKEWMWGIA